MNILTRNDAIKKGFKKYFTGKPCKNGHISERWISNGCIECHNNWISNNLDRVRSSKKKYVLNNPNKVKTSKKIYAKNNPNKVKTSKKIYAKNNPEKWKKYKKKWIINNPEKYKFLEKKRSDKHIKNITDTYIAKLIRQQFGPIKISQIPSQIIKLKRSIINVRRFLNEQQHC